MPVLGADLQLSAYLPGGAATVTLIRDTNADGQASNGEVRAPIL
ncbi:hypothetical protein [Deinococcus aquatilis]|nr:hypothetical protein [Deinococcus aquatilis]